MDNDQKAKLDSYKRVRAFNTQHSTELTTIPDYDGRVTLFNAIMEKILGRSQSQQET